MASAIYLANFTRERQGEKIFLRHKNFKRDFLQSEKCRKKIYLRHNHKISGVLYLQCITRKSYYFYKSMTGEKVYLRHKFLRVILFSARMPEKNLFAL